MLEDGVSGRYADACQALNRLYAGGTLTYAEFYCARANLDNALAGLRR